MIFYDREIEHLSDEIRVLRDTEAELVRQIATAKERARAGEYASSSWYRRINVALRKTRMDIEYKQRAVKLLYTRWAHDRQNTYEARFIAACRERLPSETLEVIEEDIEKLQ